ncbi:MAG TPA: VWA domain-containing protein [Bacteroidia bacterium]|nr:VWA domain-containing protein [Bacteroidia bacterium]HNU34638.1 VWA domain-containing protein [Bacteroidia bacterium]
MFRFAQQEYLLLLAAVPVFVVLYFLLRSWRKNALKKFGDNSLVLQLMPLRANTKPLVKFILITLAFVFLTVAIAGPQLGTKLEEVKHKGVDVIIALDVSNSMKAEDIKPNRLERSKQAIARLIDKLQGDRIGLIVFAGEAYVQLPITTDYGAAKLFLGSIDSDIVPTQGTAIGKAIDLAIESFAGSDSNKHNKSVIVITDGENHEDDAIEAAKEAYEKNITVHTIGMGSINGSPIPVFYNGMRTGFMQDQNGQTVMTKLDENNLQQIAEAGHGKFIRATTSDDGLGIIMKEINAMQKNEFGSKMFTDYADQFQYFIAIALLLLLIEFIISEKRSKWIDALNLFGQKK